MRRETPAVQEDSVRDGLGFGVEREPGVGSQQVEGGGVRARRPPWNDNPLTPRKILFKWGHIMTVEAGQKSTRSGTVRVHTVRTRDGGRKTLKYGRKQAILLFCTECLGWEDHPKTCTAPLCPLYPFRGLTMASQYSDEKRGRK